MEHLATFTVTKETGIVYPADGMRRLLQLEKSNGIWSQKMQLRLERNWVLIMDNETGVKIHHWFFFSKKEKKKKKKKDDRRRATYLVDSLRSYRRRTKWNICEITLTY